MVKASSSATFISIESLLSRPSARLAVQRLQNGNPYQSTTFVPARRRADALLAELTLVCEVPDVGVEYIP